MSKLPKLIAGWREWAALPDLDVKQIKVKLDTGARTSSLHAFDLSTFTQMGQEWVRFDIHPEPENEAITHTCVSPIVDHRWIRSSIGRKQKRFIIHTTLKIGEFSTLIELSLANRDEMGFGMLIGRMALKRRILVDPSHSFLLSRPSH